VAAEASDGGFDEAELHSMMDFVEGAAAAAAPAAAAVAGAPPPPPPPAPATAQNPCISPMLHPGVSLPSPPASATAAAAHAAQPVSARQLLAGAALRHRMIGECEAGLEKLRDEHKGRRGRYPKAAAEQKGRLDRELKLLRDGRPLDSIAVTPAARPSEAAVLQTARATPAIAQRLSHPQHPPSGR
jgi:hypothetical protein